MDKSNIKMIFGEILSDDEFDFDSETESEHPKKIVKVVEIVPEKIEDEKIEESVKELSVHS